MMGVVGSGGKKELASAVALAVFSIANVSCCVIVSWTLRLGIRAFE